MNVTLLTRKQTLLDMERTAAYGALTCHDNTKKFENPLFNPSDTLKNIIRLGHESVLEHINFSFEIKNLSRACLQELARHRHISLSVESTRHTLKQKLLNDEIVIFLPKDIDDELENMIRSYLQDIFDYIANHPDVPNDHLKYAVIEAVCSNLIITLNLRELRHVINVRSAPQALREFQQLSQAFFDAIPEEFKYLLEDRLHHEN